MGVHKRLKERRRAKAQPFARVGAAHLLAVACTLSPDALRLLLLLHAAWTVRHDRAGAEHGRAVLPYAEALRRGFKSRQVVARAFREVKDSGLIVLDRAGTRPARSGGARGEAAVWRVPNREGGDHGVHVPLPAGMQAPSGAVRWNVGRLRADSTALSGPALKILTALIAWRPRDRDGALVTSDPIAVSISDLSLAVRLPRSTTADALSELIQGGRVHAVAGGEGRSARRYEIEACYRRHERHRPEPSSMNAGSVAGHKAIVSVP